MSLDIYRGSLRAETAATLIERALARFLVLAFQQRLLHAPGEPTTPDAAALRRFRRESIFDNALRFVDSVGKTYRFDAFDSRPDDGAAVLAPFDAKGSGRWVQEGATPDQLSSPHRGIRDAAIRIQRWALRRDGFAKQVRIYEGDYDDEAIAEVFSQKPCFVVLPYRKTRDAKSLVPGTYYRKKFLYRIWGISQSLRKGPAGLLSSEQDGSDPGLDFLMGSVESALAGSTLGIPGVISTEIGDEEVVAHDLTNRVFCNALDISVAATLHYPDDDLLPYKAVTVTTQLPGRGAGEPPLDLANYVAVGCFPPRPAPLLSQIAGGIAYINRRLVSAIPQTVHFPASCDTYRDLLPSGGFVVQSVPLGSDPPPLPDQALRVGVTTTDASGIVSDLFLCSTLLNLVGPDRIPKEL